MFKKNYLRLFKYFTGNLKIISPLKTKILYIIHPLVTDRLMTQISIILEDLQNLVTDRLMTQISIILEDSQNLVTAITILYIDDDNKPMYIQAIQYEGYMLTLALVICYLISVSQLFYLFCSCI
jgi:hypothetical protein